MDSEYHCKILSSVGTEIKKVGVLWVFLDLSKSPLMDVCLS